MINKSLMRHIDRATMLLCCLAMICLPGCGTTKTVYVTTPCQVPDSLSKPSEALPLLRQLDQTLTPSSGTPLQPVPATPTDSKTRLTGPQA